MNSILAILLASMINYSNTVNNQRILNDTPTLNSVFDYMIEKDILYPDIHLQIIVVETGWLKKVYKKNNLCNWRNSDKRYKHDYDGYILFDTSWTESIDYLKEWQDKYYPMYLEHHKPGDYWDFIWWIGYVDGKSYSARGKRYIEYCKKIDINFQ